MHVCIRFPNGKLSKQDGKKEKRGGGKSNYDHRITTHKA